MHLVLTIHANKIEAITQGDMLLSFLPLKKYDAYINIIVEFSQGKRVVYCSWHTKLVEA